MKALYRSALLVTLAASLSFAGQKPGISAVQEAEIRQLLKLTGVTATVEQQMSRMAEELSPMVERSLPPGQRRHEIAQAFATKFRARASSEALTQLMIPIYAKYLSEEDVKSLLRFYQTPAGQRLIKVMPQMMKEAGEAGQEWGTKVATDVIEELGKEYPELGEKH
jgi:uncharacterized protein